MEKYLGTWSLDKNENFDEYLKAREVPFPIRMALKVMSFSKTFARDSEDGQYIVTNKSTMKTFSWTFKLNEPFKKETYDGTMHEIKFEIKENGELWEIHVHEKDGFVEIYIYSIEDEYFVCKSEFKNVTMKRFFKKK